MFSWGIFEIHNKKMIKIVVRDNIMIKHLTFQLAKITILMRKDCEWGNKVALNDSRVKKEPCGSTGLIADSQMTTWRNNLASITFRQVYFIKLLTF